MNYGDATIPLDRWFGTWHDGSPEGEARMQERYRKRKEKLRPQGPPGRERSNPMSDVITWITACRLDQIEREGATRFDHNGRSYAICRGPDDSVWCTAGLCTHEAVHLAAGLMFSPRFQPRKSRIRPHDDRVARHRRHTARQWPGRGKV